MAMRIAPVPYFWALVSFAMLADSDTNEDKFVEASLKVKYKRLTTDEHTELMKRSNAGRVQALKAMRGEIPADQVMNEVDGVKPVSDREIIDQVVLDWDDMLGDDDQKLPFNKDNLDRALQSLGCQQAIVRKYFDAHQKALEKNFARPSNTTSAG